MTKAEFIAQIAEQTGNTQKHTEEMLNAFLDGIGTALAEGEKVSFVGFGVFETKQRGERNVHSLQTGSTVVLPAASIPSFRPGKGLKEKVNPK
jgi:DNA-binding protein HU-beta